MNQRQKAVLQEQTDSHIADLSRVCETIKAHLYPDAPITTRQRQLLSNARDCAAKAMQMLEALEDCL